MYNSKFALIIDLIFAGLFTVSFFGVGISDWGEPYNELYFSTSFICGILTRFIGEKLENFKKDK